MNRNDAKTETRIERCRCPFCEAEVVAEPSPFCAPCNLRLRYCRVCKTAAPSEARICPTCGGKLE
ncbi:MAG: hypothetical protein HY667_02165 [Chloroflexi bacterium]|nr:hypothetical protein [Chloroflexota bacterium]